MKQSDISILVTMKQSDISILVIAGLLFLFIIYIGGIVGIIAGNFAMALFFIDLLFLFMIMVTLKDGRN